LWSKCIAANVSPFITRGDLRNILKHMTRLRQNANAEALALYYESH